MLATRAAVRKALAGRRIPAENSSRWALLGLARAALLGVAGCTGGGQRRGGAELVFSFFPDPTRSVRGLIEQFGRENGDGVSVRLRGRCTAIPGGTSASQTPSSRAARVAQT